MVKLELTREQVQKILNILGRVAYAEIYDLIDSIMRQLNAQIEAQQK